MAEKVHSWAVDYSRYMYVSIVFVHKREGQMTPPFVCENWSHIPELFVAMVLWWTGGKQGGFSKFNELGAKERVGRGSVRWTQRVRSPATRWHAVAGRVAASTSSVRFDADQLFPANGNCSPRDLRNMKTNTREGKASPPSLSLSQRESDPPNAPQLGSANGLGYRRQQ